MSPQNCGFPEKGQDSDFERNRNATIFAIISVLIVIIFYCWNIYFLARENWRILLQRSGSSKSLVAYGKNISIFIRDIKAATPRRSENSRPYEVERSPPVISPLSALLASAVGVILILASWPQPLEAAAILVFVLAQASFLGWQDHDPEKFVKDLAERIPDVAAVVVAAFALGDARQKYLDNNPENGFQSAHDPAIQMRWTFWLAGIGFALGLLQEFHFVFEPKIKEKFEEWGWRTLTKSTILASYSWLFVAIQIPFMSMSIDGTSSTLKEGCLLYNFPKVLSFVALCIGVVYSLSLASMRLFFSPVGSPEEQIQQEIPREENHPAASPFPGIMQDETYEYDTEDS